MESLLCHIVVENICNTACSVRLSGQNNQRQFLRTLDTVVIGNGRNVMLLCSTPFKWQFNDFVCGNVSLNNYEFLHNFYSRVGNDDWSAAQLLTEILRIRDDDFRVLFNDGGRLSASELNCILSYVASSRS